MSNFQIIALGLCIIFLLIGVGVFAAFGGFLGGTAVGEVSIWGTIDSGVMSGILTTLRSQDKAFEDVHYTQMDPATYDAALLNGMASGSGPDLFLVGQDHIVAFSDKVSPIPYSALSQAEFTGSYIDEGQIFLTPQGALALPFSVDPLVMYWNRDLFAGAGLAAAPQYWNDFFNIAPKITSLDQGANVQKSAVALGTWKNVAHAKEILSALFLQTGDPIVSRASDGTLQPVFGQKPAAAERNPAESALQFYTEFANPTKTSYSWNGSLPSSAAAFTAGDVAVYFGFASEYPGILARNPNLHVSVALLPQLQGNSTHLTFGAMTGVALSRSAHNAQGALIVAEKITGQQAISLLVQAQGLPPVRRDVVLDTSNNAAASAFAQSSLIAAGWLDPSPTQTTQIFQRMVESVISGASQPGGAVSDGAQSLSQLFNH